MSFNEEETRIKLTFVKWEKVQVVHLIWPVSLLPSKLRVQPKPTGQIFVGWGGATKMRILECSWKQQCMYFVSVHHWPLYIQVTWFWWMLFHALHSLMLLSTLHTNCNIFQCHSTCNLSDDRTSHSFYLSYSWLEGWSCCCWSDDGLWVNLVST